MWYIKTRLFSLRPVVITTINNLIKYAILIQQVSLYSFIYIRTSVLTPNQVQSGCNQSTLHLTVLGVKKYSSPGAFKVTQLLWTRFQRKPNNHYRVKIKKAMNWNLHPVSPGNKAGLWGSTLNPRSKPVLSVFRIK